MLAYLDAVDFIRIEQVVWSWSAQGMKFEVTGSQIEGDRNEIDRPEHV